MYKVMLEYSHTELVKLFPYLHISFYRATPYPLAPIETLTMTPYVSPSVCQSPILYNKSSAVAEMGDRGHNRYGPKRGGCCASFADSWEPV